MRHKPGAAPTRRRGAAGRRPARLRRSGGRSFRPTRCRACAGCAYLWAHTPEVRSQTSVYRKQKGERRSRKSGLRRRQGLNICVNLRDLWAKSSPRTPRLCGEISHSFPLVGASHRGSSSRVRTTLSQQTNGTLRASTS